MLQIPVIFLFITDFVMGVPVSIKDQQELVQKLTSRLEQARQKLKAMKKMSVRPWFQVKDREDNHYDDLYNQIVDDAKSSSNFSDSKSDPYLQKRQQPDYTLIVWGEVLGGKTSNSGWKSKF